MRKLTLLALLLTGCGTDLTPLATILCTPSSALFNEISQGFGQAGLTFLPDGTCEVVSATEDAHIVFDFFGGGVGLSGNEGFKAIGTSLGEVDDIGIVTGIPANTDATVLFQVSEDASDVILNDDTPPFPETLSLTFQGNETQVQVSAIRNADDDR